MRKRWHSLFCVLLLSQMALGRDVDVTAYGAKGDSTTLNTQAIQSAIDDCALHGGGRVVFPAGKFLTGTIVLKNHVTIQLAENAVILGSTHVEDYKNLDPFADGLGTDVGWALIVAVDANHIGIEGRGSIDGQGSQLKAEQIQTDNRPEGQRWGRRPFLLRIVRCHEVNITGVTLLYAAAWTAHFFQSSALHLQDLRILSRGVAHNDGIDIDGCQDVQVKDCDINSGDDALCFKTTSSKMACRNIRVTGMRLKSSQGGIKMGTESMADFENITISHCYIYDTNNGGIKLLSVDGAHLRKVELSDITMVNVKTPILVRLGSRLSVFRNGQDVQQPTGTIEQVLIRNVTATTPDSTQLQVPSGILITGVPGHPVSGLTLENIEIELAGGGNREQARQRVPEAVDKYPEVKTFGPLVPAYGVWARHVQDLTLDRINIRLRNAELRPAIVVEDGKSVRITACTLPAYAGTEAVISLENVDGATIRKTLSAGNAGAFVKVEGSASRNIQLGKNKTGAKKTTEVSSEAREAIVQISQ